jgi:ferritin
MLKAIKAPKTEWESAYEAWDDAYNHELTVSKLIFKIGEIADKESDRAAGSMLQWFYDEQIEEEEQTMKVRDLLKIVGDSTNALFMLDGRLRRRDT